MVLTTAANAMAAAATVPDAAPCTAIVKSPADAVAKADWIVEGVLQDAISMSNAPGKLSLLFADMNAIKGEWPGRRGATGTVMLGPCFPGGMNYFKAGAGKALFGHRVRAYGSKHLSDPTRQLFYIEVATVPMGALRSSAVPEKTTVHRANASNPLPGSGGWHRAHSTAGAYSIDMPAPFQDVSAVSDGKAGVTSGYMLRSTDANGLTFIAVREPNSPNASMAGSFDTEVRTKPDHVVQFKGMPAFESTAKQGANMTHSLMFRVPGGTYMLGVSFPAAREKESVAVRERYFQSLAFD